MSTSWLVSESTTIAIDTVLPKELWKCSSHSYLILRASSMRPNVFAMNALLKVNSIRVQPGTAEILHPVYSGHIFFRDCEIEHLGILFNT